MRRHRSIAGALLENHSAALRLFLASGLNSFALINRKARKSHRLLRVLTLHACGWLLVVCLAVTLAVAFYLGALLASISDERTVPTT